VLKLPLRLLYGFQHNGHSWLKIVEFYFFIKNIVITTVTSTKPTPTHKSTIKQSSK